MSAAKPLLATRSDPPAAGDGPPSGAAGFRLVLVYWALLLSLIAAVTLVTAGFAFDQGWCVIAGVLALRVYAWAGNANRDLLDRLWHDDA